jgi:hypothetical protein
MHRETLRRRPASLLESRIREISREVGCIKKRSPFGLLKGASMLMIDPMPS